eukprot:gnl/TRDRNA2_/TRDRNA2_182393_c0_seq1.p1 gnl/TRDRNA2_/TRDRNA2_182393_c0~~gnl/TRDRNA2_/TRDRNA2_182393_c0_seq1.p1  ORF type:complete len:278 (-),score=69.58 gnl/TRDRNA2_/TRDRNA2_182393_c0_seq1:48-881(-)
MANSASERSKPLPVGLVLQPPVAAPPLVPRLSLGQQPQQSAAPITDAPRVGQASTRTRMRALLRKKARARRREEREAADTDGVADSVEEVLRAAPVSFQIFSARNVSDKQNLLTARSNNSSAYDIFTARRLEEDKADDGESEWSSPETIDSNDDDVSVSSCDDPGDGAASGLIRGSQAWDHPLTQEEKRTRVLLLCEKEEALDDKEIRRGERLVEKLRGKLRALRQDVVRLRQERNAFKTKATNLCEENRKLRSRAVTEREDDEAGHLTSVAIRGGA